MNCLIIVHVEPDFNYDGIIPDPLLHAILKEAPLFNRVINVTMTGDVYDQLKDFEQKEWIWGLDVEGWTKKEKKRWKHGIDWIETTGHMYSKITPWMHELPKNIAYTLVGGSRHECLQDMYDIFKHLGLYTMIAEKLTY